MSRADGSSVFLRMLFSRSGYLVSLWWGFATMSASFRRLHCLCVSPHCIEPDKERKWNFLWARKSQTNQHCIGTRCTGGLWDENWPWRRSWRARCPWEACACTPCSPPPPCSNGCRAGTWNQTEHTNINKDMRQRNYSHRQEGKHIYFCHSLKTRWNLELGHKKHRQWRCRERMWTVGYMETK